MATEIQRQLVGYAANALLSIGGNPEIVLAGRNFMLSGYFPADMETLLKEAESAFEAGYPNGGEVHVCEVNVMRALIHLQKGEGEWAAQSCAYAMASALGPLTVCNGEPSTATMMLTPV